jgi:hypothetical protein
VTTQAVWASGRGRLLRMDARQYSLSPVAVTDKEAVLGRLIACEGMLIAAGAGGLTAFVDSGGALAFLKGRLEQAKQPAERFGLLLRRGQLALAAGQQTEADAALRAAEQEAAKVRGAKLEAQVRPWLYQLLLRQLGAARDGAEVDRLIEQARKYSDEARAEMAVLLVGMFQNEKQGRAEKAVQLAQELAEKFQSQVAAEADLLDAAGFPVPAGQASGVPLSGYALGQGHAGRLLKAHGRGLYSAQDEAARRALEEGRRKKNVPALLDAQRRYPFSGSCAEMLYAAAEILFAEGTQAKSPAQARDSFLRAARALGQVRNYPDQQKQLPLRPAQAAVTARLAPQLVGVLYADARQAAPATFGGVRLEPQALFEAAAKAGMPELPLEAEGPIQFGPPAEEVYRLKKGSYGLLRDKSGRAMCLGERVVLTTERGLLCLDTQLDAFEAGTVWTVERKRMAGSPLLGHWLADLRRLAVLDRERLTIHDSATGKLLHEVKLADWELADWFDAAAEGDLLALSFYWGRMACVDLSKPAVRWRHSPERGGDARRLEVRGGVLMAKQASYRDPPYGHGTCYDARDGRLLLDPKVRNWDAWLSQDGLAVYHSVEALSVCDPWQSAKPPVWKHDLKPEPAQVLGVGRQYLVVSAGRGNGSLAAVDLGAPGNKVLLRGADAVADVAPDRNWIYLLCGKASGGRAGPHVKLLAPAVIGFELPGGRQVWRKELAPAGEGYCLLSWLQKSNGCLSVTLLSPDMYKPGRAWVLDERRGEAAELAPAVEGRPEDWHDCEMPAVVNGRALLRTESGLVLFRSRL